MEASYFTTSLTPTEAEPLQLLSGMLAATLEIHQAAQIETVLQILLTAAMALSNAEYGSLAVRDKDQLIFRQVVGRTQPSTQEISVERHLSLAQTNPITSLSFFRVTLRPHSSATSSRDQEGSPALPTFGCRVPVVSTHLGLLACLELYFRDSAEVLSEIVRKCLEALANHAALAIEKNHDLRFAQIERDHARTMSQTCDEFLCIAAHELKTPLTTLSLCVDSLRRLAIHKGDRILEIASRQNQRLAELVKKLMSVGKLDLQLNGAIHSPTNLIQIIHRIREDLDETIRRAGCTLELDILSELDGLWDPIQIEQIITNLLSNAIKYAPGKPIRITARKVTDLARITVEDQGDGIAEDLHAKIFNRFERAGANPSSEGLGLGLYIVQKFVVNHRGKIYVESESGKGAKFIVEIPLNPSCA